MKISCKVSQTCASSRILTALELIKMTSRRSWTHQDDFKMASRCFLTAQDGLGKPQDHPKIPSRGFFGALIASQGRLRRPKMAKILRKHVPNRCFLRFSPSWVRLEDLFFSFKAFFSSKLFLRSVVFKAVFERSLNIIPRSSHGSSTIGFHTECPSATGRCPLHLPEWSLGRDKL